MECLIFVVRMHKTCPCHCYDFVVVDNIQCLELVIFTEYRGM